MQNSSEFLAKVTTLFDVSSNFLETAGTSLRKKKKTSIIYTSFIEISDKSLQGHTRGINNQPRCKLTTKIFVISMSSNDWQLRLIKLAIDPRDLLRRIVNLALTFSYFFRFIELQTTLAMRYRPVYRNNTPSSWLLDFSLSWPRCYSPILILSYLQR